MSVVLRAAADGDFAWVREWLPAVEATVARRFDVDGWQEDLFVDARIIERNGSRSGVVILRTREPEYGDAIIELVATPPADARRGSGMQAAALIEEELRARGVRRIYAPAAAAHGIAMYFWIRLGYRPLLRPEWPCEAEGVAWLERRLDGAAS